MTSDPVPAISVVICTHNRARMLETCLRALLAQTLSADNFEIVVVDSASTDDTGAVVDDLVLRVAAPRIRLVREAVPGVSVARNAGLRTTRAALIAFVDDDCVVPREWLELGLSGLTTTDARPDSVGGPIRPRFLVAPPAWFKEGYELLTWGEEPRLLAPGESFAGGNMMFRTDVLVAIGGFPTHLQMSGRQMGLADETFVYKRLWERPHGMQGLYLPSMYVEHCIPAWKLTVSYALRRAFIAGLLAWDVENPASAGRLRSVPPILRALGGIVRASLRALGRAVRHDHWQCWAIEELEPLAAAVGRLAWSLNFRPRITQRPATEIGSP